MRRGLCLIRAGLTAFPISPNGAITFHGQAFCGLAIALSIERASAQGTSIVLRPSFSQRYRGLIRQGQAVADDGGQVTELYAANRIGVAGLALGALIGEVLEVRAIADGLRVAALVVGTTAAGLSIAWINLDEHLAASHHLGTR